MDYKEKVIALLNSQELSKEQKEKLEEIFPILKESEDERTWIINYLSNRELNSSIIAEKENLKKAIAWLEKQIEKDEEILILKDQIESLHAAIKAVKETHKIELEKQGEQKPFDYENVNIQQKDFAPKSTLEAANEVKVDNQNCVKSADKVEPKFKIGDTIYYNSFGEVKSMVVANVTTDSTDNPMYEDENGNAVFEKDLVEQKPAWSEEDCNRISSIKYLLHELDNYNFDNWLDLLKDRVFPQPRQEWSEDDEKRQKKTIHL